MSSTTAKLFFGPRPLFKTLRRVMEPVFKKHALAEAQMILDWSKIIGSEMAGRCYPEKLTFPRGKREEGTLVMAVDSGSSLLVQHSQDLLMDWINTYFGYKAVSKIQLRHTHRLNRFQRQKNPLDPLSSPSKPQGNIPLPPPDPKILENVSTIQDPHLKKALLSFYETHRMYQQAQDQRTKNPKA